MAGRGWIGKIGMGAVAIAVVAGFVLVVLRNGPMAPTRVVLAEVRAEPIREEVFGLGTVEARRAYAVGPTVPGRVLRVQVDVGERVRAGEVLAEMDPVDLDARQAAARAGIERARHALDAAGAQIRDAEARVRLAASNRARYEQLLAQRLVSPADGDARRQEHEAAQAGLVAARAAQEVAQSDLARSRADYEALEQQRGNLVLRAPVDGVVTARDAEPGSTLVAGQSVVRLVDPASLWLQTRIDQARAGRVRVGQEARVILRGRPGQPLAGRVERVEWLADSVTEERLVQVGLQAMPEQVSIGELAEVTILTAALDEALVIPNAALKREGGRTGVWRLDERRVVYQPVETGLRDLDGRVQITRGLERGDRVVIHSERELTAASRVRVVDVIQGR
ncbi:efflux RND transporter periplasmic adaptor subunit [Thiofaba sp. EF100]|uniref:efflux RND transporter periplasmic adaptor subunit n=1 Tax=Thiofaba sp. EF100 TaxID=3121274 RepID=UPI0032215D57